jgi:hypothetical protein
MTFLKYMDWALLRKQKQWLMERECEEADGILNLIDTLQDYAIDEMGVDEYVVFGETESV